MNLPGSGRPSAAERAIAVSAIGDVVAALAERRGASRRLLLGVDIDGTLATIVDHARSARLWPGALEALVALDSRADVEVVLVTGRARADAITTFGLPSVLRVVGSHGLEHHDGSAHRMGAQSAALDELESEARRIAGSAPGAWVERKPHGVVLHVRQVAAESREAVLGAYRKFASARSWTVLDGSAVVEAGVAPLDKGAAVEALRREFEATSVGFFGDDVTDEHVFRRLEVDDVGVKVGDGPTSARFRLGGPADVVTVIQKLM